MVKLLVPEVEKSYEIYVPINRTVKQVCVLINKLINEDTDGAYPIREDLAICNRFTSEVYKYETYIRNTDIRNGSQIVVF